MSWGAYQNRSTFGTIIQPSGTPSTVPAIASSYAANPVKRLSGPMKISTGTAMLPMSPRSFSPRATSPQAMMRPSVVAAAPKARTIASAVSLPTAAAASPPATTRAARAVSPSAAFTTRATPGISPQSSVAALPTTKAWSLASPVSRSVEVPPATKARIINGSTTSFSSATAMSPRATSPFSPRAVIPQAIGPRSWAPSPQYPVAAPPATKAMTIANSVPFSNATPFSPRAVIRSTVPACSHKFPGFLPTVSAPQFTTPVMKESGSYTTPAVRMQPTSGRIMTTSELVTNGRLIEAVADEVVLAQPDVAATIADVEIVEVSEPRGSEGMGLPSEMSDQTVATIKATAAVVAPKALDITQHFYDKIFSKMPELFSFFNKANQGGGVQPKALAAAVVAYASNIDNLGPLVVPKGPVEGICHKHCGLNILPAHYVVVHANLMETIGEVLDGVVTPDIAAAWSEAVLFLAKVMIDWEESLYSEAESRAGGWRNMKDMVVSNIEQVTPDVKRFTFQDSTYNGPYDFSPGQFLTVKVDPNGDGFTAPRHYTVTSAPGEPFLQCSVKRVPGGVVSNYLHDVLTIGDTVKLSPPYGIFTPSSEDKTAVLISAGIGVTPMLNYCQHFGKGVQLLVHVDKSPESHPYVDYFNSLGCKTLFHYTSMNGRPLANDLANNIVNEVGTSPAFYLCGPPSFMSGMVSALKDLGASNVNFEAFVPQLGCPIAR